MKAKRISGIVILVIGIILIIFSCYERNRVANAKAGISKGTSFMPKNAVTGAVSGSLEGKASAYDAPLLGCLIAGIIMVVVGGGMTFFFRKKRN
jgi:hypothetical protein